MNVGPKKNAKKVISPFLANIVYHIFRQLWLVLGIELMKINSNLFSIFFLKPPKLPLSNYILEVWHGPKRDHPNRKVLLQLSLFRGELLIARLSNKDTQQDGPLLAINRVITPINGLKHMGNWCVFTPKKQQLWAPTYHYGEEVHTQYWLQPHRIHGTGIFTYLEVQDT